MIDRQQSKLKNKFINVRVHTEGRAPYIPIGDEQLNDVTRLLDASGIGYTVDVDAGSADSERLSAINLGIGADVEGIQAVLDADQGGGEGDHEVDASDEPEYPPAVQHERGGRHLVPDRRGGWREMTDWEIENERSKSRYEAGLCGERCPSHPHSWCNRGSNHRGLGHACDECTGTP